MDWEEVIATLDRYAAEALPITGAPVWAQGRNNVKTVVIPRSPAKFYRVRTEDEIMPQERDISDYEALCLCRDHLREWAGRRGYDVRKIHPYCEFYAAYNIVDGKWASTVGITLDAAIIAAVVAAAKAKA